VGGGWGFWGGGGGGGGGGVGGGLLFKSISRGYNRAYEEKGEVS